MADDSYFENFAEHIKTVAEEVGALVVRELLDIPESATMPQVALNLDEVVAVVRHTRPRLIYLVESCFDVEFEIAEVAESLGQDEKGGGDDDNPALERLANKWRTQNGKPCFAFAAFMADGVLNRSIAHPAWREEFATELERIEEDARNTLADERHTLSNRDSAEVREKAAVLANHASFNAGRTSFEKRAFLAEKLFPGLDPGQLHAITQRAENLDWLNKSGFKP
ncbi:MAG: hypothetical protein QOF94_438 [Acidobacteriaceae bacterium]|jgi:hypothetical protein